PVGFGYVAVFQTIHFVSGPEVGDGRAYPIYHAGNIAAPDYREADVAHGAQQPLTQLPVHRVDAGGADTHQYPIRTELGQRDVGDLQNLRTAIGLTNHSSHGRVDSSSRHWEAG